MRHPPAPNPPDNPDAASPARPHLRVRHPGIFTSGRNPGAICTGKGQRECGEGGAEFMALKPKTHPKGLNHSQPRPRCFYGAL